MLRHQRLSLQQVIDALAISQPIPIRPVDVEPEESLQLASRLIQLASRLNVYAYEAYLLRYAERYHSALLTLDRVFTLSGKNVWGS